MGKRETLTIKVGSGDRELLEKLSKARGESLSSFVRRALRLEFARLGYLSAEDQKALGLAVAAKGEQP